MNQYSKRRELILQSFKNNMATIIFSGVAPMRSQDESYPFVADRNFYYLTGIDSENMALLMYKMDGAAHQAMFILPFDPLQAKWVGGRMLSDEVRAISEVEDIRDYSELESNVASLLNRMRKDNNFRLYFDLWHYQFDQAPTACDNFVKKIHERYPAVVIKDIFPYLTSLRLVKDEYELFCLKKAIHTTNLGIRQMMKTIKPGLNEMAMEGIFDFVLRQSGCKENSFSTIAASGQRATTLHYSDNNQIMEDGELFLCDLGATYNHYCGDISRTFPVNGKFSPRQREIYGIVLHAQDIVVENAKVGVSLRELNQMVVDYYAQELPKHGLYKDVSEYYFHSVSHHIGLDTHDVDGGLGMVLKAGNVISNEPGLYIEEESIGIRIEDDLLITGTGAKVLSKEIIKNPDEIEKFMAKEVNNEEAN